MSGIDRKPTAPWRNNVGYPNEEAAKRAMMQEATAGSNSLLAQAREPSQQVTFVYRNWKGEIRERRVLPLEIVFTHDSYHVPDQWLMHAVDMEKGARRTFAFEHILSPIRRV